MTFVAARVASVVVFVCAVLFVGCEGGRIPDFHGVALGMSPRDVRSRFDVSGKFEADPGSVGDDFKMKFTPEKTATVTSAIFEFHMGVLVAIRADVSPNDAFAKGVATVATKTIVLHRAPSPESVHVDELARDCPTHHAEAESLVH